MLLTNLFGALLMLRALSLAPVSVVQPLSELVLVVRSKKASLISIFQLLWLAFVVAILFVLLNAWLHIFKRQRREQELGEYEVVEEIIYGLESGILFGMASVVSKMGFVFVEQGFSAMFIPMCISIRICCSGTGFFYQALCPC